MKNGIAVFHILSENPEGYRPIDEVKETLRKTLLRSKQKEAGSNLLTDTMSSITYENWDTLKDVNEYFNILSDQKGKLNSTFESGFRKLLLNFAK